MRAGAQIFSWSPAPRGNSFADACRRVGEYFCPRVGDGRLANASIVALVFVILLRVGIVEILTISGAIKAALALIAASAVARSVVVLIRRA
jgi:hypothetical protein